SPADRAAGPAPDEPPPAPAPTARPPDPSPREPPPRPLSVATAHPRRSGSAAARRERRSRGGARTPPRRPRQLCSGHGYTRCSVRSGPRQRRARPRARALPGPRTTVEQPWFQPLSRITTRSAVADRPRRTSACLLANVSRMTKALRGVISGVTPRSTRQRYHHEARIFAIRPGRRLQREPLGRRRLHPDHVGRRHAGTDLAHDLMAGAASGSADPEVVA